MHTQCPECRSVYALDAQTVAQGRGQVLCVHCGATFDSLATLCDALPTEPFITLPLNPLALTPPRLEPPERVIEAPRFIEPYEPPEPLAPPEPLEPAPSAIASPPVRGSAEDFARLTVAPRFARGARQRKPARVRRPRRRKPWGWITACDVLTLLLVAQLAWIGRDALIRSPRIGGWLQATCATLGCKLPLVAAPGQLQLLASNVRSRPAADGRILAISLSVRNAARFAQPWPIVAITLSDARHQRVAMRRLRPGEYLDNPATQGRGLAPGATTALLLEVRDPGRQAVNYTFGFQ